MEKKNMKYIAIGAVGLIGACIIMEVIDESDIFDNNTNNKTQTIYDEAVDNTLSLLSAKKIVASELNLNNDETSNMSCDLEFNNLNNEYIVKCFNNGETYEYKISNDTNEIINVSLNTESAETTTTNANSSYIGEDKAKSLAINHANVTSVTYSKVELDYDDGISYYEVDFVSGNVEYEYEINAKTGEIIKYETDTINTTNSNTNSNSAEYIGESKAKSIAMSHAGVTSTDVIYTKCELDYDDGIVEYEIEFRIGNIEYEYNINAVTGDIIEYEIDRD